jgi:hypothetical protein
MKNILILCVLLAGLLVACDYGKTDEQIKASEEQELRDGDPLAAAGQVGMLDTAAQRQRRLDYINNLNKRMIVDDWDTFWLYERSNTLTPYIARTGR